MMDVYFATKYLLVQLTVNVVIPAVYPGVAVMLTVNKILVIQEWMDLAIEKIVIFGSFRSNRSRLNVILTPMPESQIYSS